MQKKFDSHAKIFGIKGNRNSQTLEKFKKSLEDHVKSSETHVIKGTYRQNQKATHYYNPKTGINVMRNEKGEFWSVWRLTKDQIKNMENRCSL